ncbi:MAG: TetR/AcrR family transcriptional regulator, partial [Treponema sp.]|nr:TetR/AcrR family transcriptional regulator [Treponema sp.]
MAAIENSKKTTKDLILDAAFSFTKKPRFTAFSMSELAERVGISKAAIYRHYESKEALFAAMNERFFNTLAELLLRLQKSCYTNPDIMPLIPFEDIIAFFANNVDYINFFIGSMANDSSFEKRIGKELENRGVTMLKHIRYNQDDKETGTPERFARLIESFYCGTSIFIFTKFREKMMQEGAKVDSVHDFSKKIVEFFTKGLEGTCKKSSRFYPQELSEKRMNEIDKMCAIHSEDLPEEDRFFTALANVIKKYSFSGVTIEKIADEMNLAKSSLYS